MNARREVMMKALGTSLVVVTCGAVACSTGPGEAPSGKHQGPIFNGEILSEAASLRSPVVQVRGKRLQRSASGVLLTPQIVLSNGHVFLDETLKKNPAAPHHVVHGLQGIGGTARVRNPPRWHPTFSAKSTPRLNPKTGLQEKGADGFLEFDVDVTGVDLAIAELETELDHPTTVFPSLDCDPALPGSVRVVSAVRHKSGIFDPEMVSQHGVINQATFPVNPGLPKIRKWEFGFDNIRSFFGTSQASKGGDSGSPVHDTANPNPLAQLVSGILWRGDTFGSIIDGPAWAIDLSYKDENIDICEWIQREKDKINERLFFFHNDFNFDGKPDFFFLSQVAPGVFSLTAEISPSPPQSFQVALPGVEMPTGVALGAFSAGGTSLVASDGLSLIPASFNEGPEPSITGDIEVPYVQLHPAYLDGDQYEDLVALREDLQLEVFLGGAQGLTLAPEIRPVPIKLDKDDQADFVWVDGDLGIHAFSTDLKRTQPNLRGHTFRDVVSDVPIALTHVRPGHFRRLSGEHVGEQDIVTLGSGHLIWCKSNLNGALVCEPAFDSPSVRFATGVIVRDINGDDLDDLRVFYSNSTPRVFLAQNNGFATNFGYRVRDAIGVDLDGDSDVDTVTIDSTGGNIALKVRLAPEGTGDFGPFVTDIPFTDPVTVIAGNFNGDEGASALTLSGASALQVMPPGAGDLAILSGGRVFSLISNTDGTLTIDEVDGDGDFVDIRVANGNGDATSDLEAVRADGSVTVFAGVPGSGGGLEPIGINYTGLPTAEGNDGKMLVLSGLGVDTVGATEARFRISVAADDSAALANLDVQIFDGDNGGLHQFEEQTNLLKTCYRLSADPCGDGNAGSCAGGPLEPIEIVTSSSDSFGDDAWESLYAGAHSPDASIAGDGLPPYNYELRVYLSTDCAVLPAPGETVAVATADAFKVRSNGMLSMPVGEFSLIGSDSDGEFSIVPPSGEFGPVPLPYLRDTDFDGSFELPIAVGASALEIQLKEADADDSDDATPGVSLGAGSGIQYSLLDPSGTPRGLVGAENGSAVTLVTNPSGNNDGETDLDVETRTHVLAASTPGTWTWRWEGVKATNAFHVFTPFGSPTTHEVLGARRRRPKLSTAEQPHFWQAERSVLERALPIVLGRRTTAGLLEGHSVEVSTVSQALAILENAGATLAGELERQLLVAKLNTWRGFEKGEDLTGALVYGTTTTTRRTLREADLEVAGLNVFPSEDKARRLVTLLSSMNLGELTYQQPGVPFPEQPMADLDEDGIFDLKDNCPTVANPLQEDDDDNRIGDACNVVPSLDCVLPRSPETSTAYFHYENPLSFRSVAVGSRNEVVSSAGYREFEQPSEFAAGWQRAFSADFVSSETLTWTLEGGSVVANRQSALCTGKELAVVDFAPQTVLFGADGVKLGDHVSVSGRSKADLASIVSGGSLELGSETSVGHAFARSDTVLGSHAAVRGSLVSGRSISNLGAASVLGTKREGAVLAQHSIAWWVDFGAAAHRAVELAENEVRELAPGDYGQVVIPSGALLRLRAGRYRFASLSVARQGALEVTAGEVALQIAETLSHQGETRSANGSRLVLGYFGSTSAAVEASFAGVVVAPNADLVLGAVRNSVYRGAFFARTLEVKPSSIVEYEPTL